MHRFYKESATDLWVVDERIGVSSGTCILSEHETGDVSIEATDGRVFLPRVDFSVIEKENGSYYSSLTELKTAAEPFINIEIGLASTPTAPIQTTLDVIYENDIDWDNSDFTGWTGDPRDLFGNVSNGGIYNESSDNPKSFILTLVRTRQATTFAIGTNVGNFSNLKATLLGSGSAERGILDLSDDDIKQTSQAYPEEELLFNAIKIEFHTSDRVDLTNIFFEHTQSSIDSYYNHKWGNNPDIDTGNKETIWDGQDEYIFTTTPQDYYLSSSSASDVGNKIVGELRGVRTDGSTIRQPYEVLTNGQNKVLIPIDFVADASNRARNKTEPAKPLLGNLYVYEDTAIVGGVPVDLSKVRSIIPIGVESTRQAVESFPEYIETGQRVAYVKLYKWSATAIRNRSTSGLAELVVAEKGQTPIVIDNDGFSEDTKAGRSYGDRTPLIIQAGSDVYINISELSVNSVSMIGGFTTKLVVL